MTYSRVFTRGLTAAALAGAVALLTLPGAEAQPGYDGLWSVVIVTKSGQCDAAYRYPIRITNGNLGNAGSTPINISGKVGKNGAVVVTVSAGDKSATGKGRLAGASGAGSWSGNGNGACSGIWEAERRG
jgi:large exoprotein involved in heme utilization and adhesion